MSVYSFEYVYIPLNTKMTRILLWHFESCQKIPGALLSQTFMFLPHSPYKQTHSSGPVAKATVRAHNNYGKLDVGSKENNLNLETNKPMILILFLP